MERGSDCSSASDELGTPDEGLASESCVDYGKLYRAVQQIKAVLESSRAEVDGIEKGAHLDYVTGMGSTVVESSTIDHACMKQAFVFDEQREVQVLEVSSTAVDSVLEWSSEDVSAGLVTGLHQPIGEAKWASVNPTPRMPPKTNTHTLYMAHWKPTADCPPTPQDWSKVQEIIHSYWFHRGVQLAQATPQGKLLRELGIFDL